MNIALLFPGQGSQYSGMGKSLCQSFPVVNQVFEEASDVLKLDMKKLCFNPGNGLSKTLYAQPAILTVSLAAFRVYMQEVGIVPRIIAGHSLGEYSALVCSEVLSFADGLKLVRQRAELMQIAADRSMGQMISVFHSDLRELELICDEVSFHGYPVTFACFNAFGQQVISGHEKGVMKVVQMLDQLGIRYNYLNVSAAFHSPLMQKAANQFAQEIEKYSFNQWNWPIISNVDALPYMKVDEIPRMLTLQMIHPVRWQETMQYIKHSRVNVCIELGPKAILRNLENQMDVFSLGKSTDLQEVKSFILQRKEQSSDPEQRTLFFSKCLAEAIGVRNRNENKDEYEKQGVEAYRELKRLQQTLDHNRTDPSLTQIQQAVDLLRSVWKAKKVSDKEQRKLLQGLFQQTRMKDLFENQV
ncbi:ACP S-malonyltransferase [Bacillus cereus]|uniref:ACP S-malonyltransferase n=1 Tax=Bacillus cereus TaxID=1396 RepID=UPI00187A13EF|nr:ACP S-malonyltransferase [Bacillus cereus]MBE7122184.1 ACP S-malonyltransferase [Bacillus cereus]